MKLYHKECLRNLWGFCFLLLFVFSLLIQEITKLTLRLQVEVTNKATMDESKQYAVWFYA